MGKKIHFLSLREARLLGDWMIENKDVVQKMYSSDVATLATQKLGFLVTRSNVESQIEAVGINTKRLPKRTKQEVMVAKVESDPRFVELEQCIRRLNARLDFYDKTFNVISY